MKGYPYHRRSSLLDSSEEIRAIKNRGELVPDTMVRRSSCPGPSDFQTQNSTLCVFSQVFKLSCFDHVIMLVVLIDFR